MAPLVANRLHSKQKETVAEQPMPFKPNLNKSSERLA